MGMRIEDAAVFDITLLSPKVRYPKRIASSTKLLEQKDFRISGGYFAAFAPIVIFPLAFLVAYLLV
jgi:hypothetical protein